MSFSHVDWVGICDLKRLALNSLSVAYFLKSEHLFADKPKPVPELVRDPHMSSGPASQDISTDTRGWTVMTDDRGPGTEHQKERSFSPENTRFAKPGRESKKPLSFKPRFPHPSMEQTAYGYSYYRAVIIWHEFKHNRQLMMVSVSW